jgi:hypothetical protein
MRKFLILVSFLFLFLLTTSCDSVSQRVEFDYDHYEVVTWNTFKHDHYDYDSRVSTDCIKCIDSIKKSEYEIAKKRIKEFNKL